MSLVRSSVRTSRHSPCSPRLWSSLTSLPTIPTVSRGYWSPAPDRELPSQRLRPWSSQQGPDGGWTMFRSGRSINGAIQGPTELWPRLGKGGVGWKGRTGPTQTSTDGRGDPPTLPRPRSLPCPLPCPQQRRHPGLGGRGLPQAMTGLTWELLGQTDCPRRLRQGLRARADVGPQAPRP